MLLNQPKVALKQSTTWRRNGVMHTRVPTDTGVTLAAGGEAGLAGRSTLIVQVVTVGGQLAPGSACDDAAAVAVTSVATARTAVATRRASTACPGARSSRG